MSGLYDLIRAVNDVRSRQKEFLVATVVRAGGSSSRGPGARVLLSEDRWLAGAVRGGFGEHDPLPRALRLVRENAPVLLRHDVARADDLGWALGLGCDGDFEVLVERVGPGTTLDPLAFIERCVRGQLRGAMATVCRSESRDVQTGARMCVTGDGEVRASGLPEPLAARLVEQCRRAIASGRTAVHTYDEGGGVSVLVEAIAPPPRLFLFGAGHDAAPVANLARAVGWDVYVCVRRARAETRERFAPADATVVASAENIRTLIRASDHPLALVMSHVDQSDRDALALLLRSPVRYIGVLGSRSRAAKLLEAIGYDIDRDPRVHATGGVGAVTPQEVALAAIADIHAALRAPLRAIRSLRDGRLRHLANVDAEPSSQRSRAADHEPISSSHASPT